PLPDQPEEHWRTRPGGLNSIAWLVWHMARAEESGINRLVFDSPQVLDDPEAHWPHRMNVSLRHHGAHMTSAEVDHLSADADVGPWWAYGEAVAEGTWDLVGGIKGVLLDEPVEAGRTRRQFDEGILRSPRSDWSLERPPYHRWPNGDILVHVGLMHRS